MFPDLAAADDEFLFTYLHPGEYYVTIIADINGDGFPGLGDITHKSEKVNIESEKSHKLKISNINVQN